jgi:uncharacterized FlaG/YvyC family protein
MHNATKKIRHGGLMFPGERKDPMNELEVGRINAIGTEPVNGYQASQEIAQAKTAKEKIQSVESANPAVRINIGDIRVSFQVEGSDNEVIITVTDKQSGHIIRTIPFDKMQDVTTGALFQYSK